MKPGGDATPDLRYTNAPQRRSDLRDLVRANGFCSSAELSRILNVSEMTIRRDVQTLGEAGDVISVHGGAAAVPERVRVSLNERFTRRQTAKTAIGQKAATLIQPDSVLGFDSGTTALAVADAVGVAHEKPFVLSNSLPVLNRFAEVPGAHVVSLGGVLNAELGLLVVNERSQVGSLRLDQLFLGASAIRDHALYCGTVGDALTKVALLGIADEVVLVADSSKFVDARRAMTFVTALESVDTVVTDWQINDAEVARLEALGLRVLVAEPPPEQMSLGRDDDRIRHG